jgi:hypothetical protein
MRKLLLFLAALIISFGTLMTISSCNKDEEESCDCGYITAFDYDAYYYYILIRNECSGHEDWFYCDFNTWYYSDYGDVACSADGSSWKKSVPIDPTKGIEKPKTGKQNIN